MMSGHYPRNRRRVADRWEVEPGSVLAHHVTLDDGSTYTHRCRLETFTEVLHTINEHDGPINTGILWSKVDAPKTQISTALAFLKERSCLNPGVHRRHQIAVKHIVEDGLTEFHALKEKA